MISLIEVFSENNKIEKRKQKRKENNKPNGKQREQKEQRLKNNDREEHGQQNWSAGGTDINQRDNMFD